MQPNAPFQKINILATLGPSSLQQSVVKKMDEAGVDVFRLNLSHTPLGGLSQIVQDLRDWTNKTICFDTQGAQIRTGKMRDGKVLIPKDSVVRLVGEDHGGDESTIPLYPKEAMRNLEIGDVLFIDFHSVIVQIISREDTSFSGRVLFGGEVGSNKGISCDRQIPLPPFTQQDKEAFAKAKDLGIACFALSFTSSKEDVEQLRNLFPYKIVVISKIESKRGLENLEGICEVSDAVLIDRGDLSREVPLSKIAFAQKSIIERARATNMPVYVATNLLESMIEDFRPTRAEINDITNTILDGAQGLVLAAETAIGKYPVQSVRMVANIIKEAQHYQSSSHIVDYVNEAPLGNFIAPHGGVLVQNFMDESAIEAQEMPEIEVDEKIFSDIVQIAEGTYSPLRGFMNYEELMGVLHHYKLPDGTVWTLPIILQLPKSAIHFGNGDTVAFRRAKDGKRYGFMKVSGIQHVQLDDIARKWFDTDSLEHPGVAYVMARGEYIVSGDVFLCRKPTDEAYAYHLGPHQLRQLFRELGWQKVLGFHTRNVVHRGHEFIQRKALEMIDADGMLISPVVGPKKPTDFSARAIVRSYELMMKNHHYDPYQTLLATFHTYSRYSGPREAVFTALCRKNFGCTHFVVGRDHTGVGNFYAPDASHRIFDKIGDIGIVPLRFGTVYFCKACGEAREECSHGEEQKLEISGTQVRKNLLEKGRVPDYLVRPDVADMLETLYKEVNTAVFENPQLEPTNK